MKSGYPTDELRSLPISSSRYDVAVIGAGAVLVDNTKVRAGAIMLGVPAKERGDVSEAQAERFRRTAEHYAELGRQYKAEGGLE